MSICIVIQQGDVQMKLSHQSTYKAIVLFQLVPSNLNFHDNRFVLLSVYQRLAHTFGIAQHSKVSSQWSYVTSGAFCLSLKGYPVIFLVHSKVIFFIMIKAIKIFLRTVTEGRTRDILIEMNRQRSHFFAYFQKPCKQMRETLILTIRVRTL